jgi:hypothetical protein
MDGKTSVLAVTAIWHIPASKTNKIISPGANNDLKETD